MYKYDEYDQQMVDTRVEEFRDQVRRRLSGELTEDQFKPLRLQNGLYLQLHAYMLRVAVPYGTLNSTQMKLLGDIADKYDRGYGHFTTRQNIQYNWIKLEDTPDILAELAKVEMHAIQTSGNCIRNISSDQFAGAAADEIIDPAPTPSCCASGPASIPNSLSFRASSRSLSSRRRRIVRRCACTTSASRWCGTTPAKSARSSMQAAAWAAPR